ncbi:MAG: very short patch repair endonuclease [Solirubrobacterales bacterium]|nr:very short patch repair endonuclease [Solirubrobacterales bacterium]
MIRLVTVTPSSAHASATMRANHGRDTGPEVALRSALHARGLRFRKNVRLDLGQGRRVRPDIAFPSLRLAVFVDGCFWHGCQEHRSLPTSNASFWREKIEGTARRDKQQVAWLYEAGWTVLRVWEHDVPDCAERRIIELVDELRSRRPTA